MAIGQRQDICILTCFFNPAGYLTPLANFTRATAKLLELGAPLVTVEAAFDNLPFQLAERPGQTLIQLRAPARLWLKERLLNVALAHVPPECTKVAWVDGDLLFERPDWLDAASAMLDELEVVQLFDTIRHLPEGAEEYRGISIRENRSLFSLVATEGPEALWKMKSGLLPYAVPGGAFAAKKSVLASGLYDRHILGESDNVFAYATLGALDKVDISSPALARDVRLWELNFASHRRSFTHGYLPGTVYHLWHGEVEQRGYLSRNELLRLYEFDPNVDIALHENGTFRWNSPKLGLHDATKLYFRSRMEDGVRGVGKSAAPSLEHGALISELYRRIAESSEAIHRAEVEKCALEQQLVVAQKTATETAEWAKELKRGNDWAHNQLTIWQQHAHALETSGSQPAPTRPMVVVVVAPDSESSHSVLAALAPHEFAVLEIDEVVLPTPRHTGRITLTQTLAQLAATNSPELTVIALNYMNLTPAALSHVARELAGLQLPVIWSKVANPLEWYCRTTRSASSPTSPAAVDPVQFVALVEEQRRREQELFATLSNCRGASVCGDFDDAARASLQALLNLTCDPSAPASSRPTAPILDAKAMGLLVDYLQRIGAQRLLSEVVAPAQPYPETEARQ